MGLFKTRFMSVKIISTGALTIAANTRRVGAIALSCLIYFLSRVGGTDGLKRHEANDRLVPPTLLSRLCQSSWNRHQGGQLILQLVSVCFQFRRDTRDVLALKAGHRQFLGGRRAFAFRACNCPGPV